MSQAINLFSASQDCSSQEDNCPSLALALSLSPNPLSPPSQVPSCLQLPRTPEPFPAAAFPAAFYSQSLPLFYPLPPADLPPVPAFPPAKRRAPRGSSKVVDGITKAMRKSIHAEKNRQFARESRERKRAYVQGLEREVATLKTELAWYKERFASYALIDRKRDISTTEKTEAIQAALRELSQTRAAPGQLSELIIQKFTESFNERKKALEQLFRIMLEVAVPTILRFQLWAVDNNIDVFDPEHLHKYFGYQPGSETMKVVLEHMKTAHANHAEIQRELKTKLSKVTINIRKNVKQMLEAQREIQMDTAKVMHCLKKFISPNYTVEHAIHDMNHAIPRLSGREELSDESIFKVSEEDFLCDTADASLEDGDPDPGNKGSRSI